MSVDLKNLAVGAIAADGKTPAGDILTGKKLIGLYLSASWCPPCQAFTPKLAAAYNEQTDKGEPIEFLWLPMDNDIDDYDAYGKKMPFPRLPFEDSRVQAVADAAGVQTIPALLLCDENGTIKNKSGVDAIRVGREFPWGA